jgi:hypothetical protein
VGEDKGRADGSGQVDMDEFRAAFERFGELCSSRHFGVPAINPKPASSSAFVNFCRQGSVCVCVSSASSSALVSF